MAKVYEMLWDCPFCGTQKILAKTHRACPQCQAPQDPAWRYFPSETEQVEVKNHQFQGKDKQCTACGSLNVATANFCGSCGASLENVGALATELSSGQGDGTFAQPETHNNWNLAEQARIAEAELAQTHPEETPEETLQRLKQTPLSLTSKRATRAKSLFAHSSPMEKVAFSIAGCIGFLFYGPILLGSVLVGVTTLFDLWQEPPAPAKPTTLRVIGHQWQRTVDIETYQRLSKQDWESSLPSDASYVKAISCEQRERATDDGTIEASYCTYNVDRWQSDDQVIASGDSLTDTLYWPTPELKTCEQLGCQREGERRETYTLRFIDPIADKQHTCTVSQEVWQANPVGTQVKVMVKLGDELRDRDCQQMEYL